jgi:hypothetical protein
MRHVGRVIVSQTDRPDLWTTVYRAFLEQEGLLYQAGAEWVFLQE